MEKRNDENSDFWVNAFKDGKVYNKLEPLTEDKITAELELFKRPLTKKEKEELSECMSLDEIEKCSNYFAGIKLPMSYINFLKFCNIVEMKNGERYFQFLSLKEIREYTIAYQFLKYMNGAITFGLNGGGVHYIFDARKKNIYGEYPIYASNSGNLGWEADEAYFLGNTFLEVIADKTNIEDIIFR